MNVVLSVVALGVYAVFISAQMGRYSNLYTERKSLIIRDEVALEAEAQALPLWKAATLLVAGLLVVCLIAESMGQLIETGITDLGLPSSLAGVLVAMLILAPEALTPCRQPHRGKCNALSTPFMARWWPP